MGSAPNRRRAICFTKVSFRSLLLPAANIKRTATEPSTRSSCLEAGIFIRVLLRCRGGIKHAESEGSCTQKTRLNPKCILTESRRRRRWTASRTRFGRDEISVMMDDKTRERAFSSLVNAKGSEGVAAGATIGGVLGAIVAGANRYRKRRRDRGDRRSCDAARRRPIGCGVGWIGRGCCGGRHHRRSDRRRHRRNARQTIRKKGCAKAAFSLRLSQNPKDHRADVRRALDRDVEYAGETHSRSLVESFAAASSVNCEAAAKFGRHGHP